ncbi:MAG: hypothetical protein V1859_06745 [archaeon]
MAEITDIKNNKTKINPFVNMIKCNSDEEVKLTKNEQKVLKQIILNEKVSDNSIADSMKISQQAVNQIRTRLERFGVIKGYTPIIDFEKIGINIILLSGIALKQSVWEKKRNGKLNKA